MRYGFLISLFYASNWQLLKANIRRLEWSGSIGPITTHTFVVFCYAKLSDSRVLTLFCVPGRFLGLSSQSGMQLHHLVDAVEVEDSRIDVALWTGEGGVSNM